MEGHVSVATFNAVVSIAFVWGMVLGWIMFRRSREDAARDAETIDQALALIDETAEAITLRTTPFPWPIVKRLRDFVRQTRDELSP